MFVGHGKKTLEWFVPNYMSAESVSESEKKFCGSESGKIFSDPQNGISDPNMVPDSFVLLLDPDKKKSKII
jgi:hypothetical protein